MQALRFYEASLPAGDEAFALRLVLALEEREIHRAWARQAAQQNDELQQARHEREAWQTLVGLMQEFPDRRGDIYNAINEGLEGRSSLDDLDPFERCALLAVRLSDDSAESEAELRRAIQLGDRYLGSTRTESSALAAELLFNLAVAEYRLGDTASAAARLLTLSREFPGAVNARRAATLAVELAATLQTDAGHAASKEPARLYGAALAHLLDRYPRSEESRYWRFFFAQWLDQRGDFEAAARQYGLVDETHEHYVESLFLEVRALAQSLSRQAAAGGLAPVETRRRVDKLFEKYRAFVTKASSGLGALADESERSARRRLLARAKVNVGEVLVLPDVERYAAALELMAGFETDVAGERELAARVWRLRLTAYQKLGRLNEAARAIPAYLAADPGDAGPTLQTLFLTVADDVRRASFDVMDDDIAGKAELLLMLARHIHDWAESPSSRVTETQLRAVKIQLAEANLWAGHYEEAWQHFLQLRADGQSRQDQRVVYGCAETLFHLGRFEEALAEFNRLATGLAPSDPLRWRALLRDLQCRNALEHEPAGIIKVIEQQKYLYPDLGGPELAPQFERLLRENQRRRDGK
jgi:tetratricopeptide (TPR) repeat protein